MTQPLTPSVPVLELFEQRVKDGLPKGFDANVYRRAIFLFEACLRRDLRLSDLSGFNLAGFRARLRDLGWSNNDRDVYVSDLLYLYEAITKEIGLPMLRDVPESKGGKS